MIRTGLVSITFRQMSCNEVISLVTRAGLSGIEWGGDVHVPHGESKLAWEVGKRTREVGIAVAAYGSYYRVGVSPKAGLDFESVLESAVALRAPTIRVWAGAKGSAQADETYWGQVVEDGRRIAEIAAKAEISISYEFHGGTLTDTYRTALELQRRIDHPNVLLYWQPAVGISVAERMEGLAAVLPHVSNVHVFQWEPVDGKTVRRPLKEGAEEWAGYLQALRESGRDHWAMIEFVEGDAPGQFLADARTLCEWV